MAALTLFLALLLAVSAGHKLAAHQRMGEAAARLARMPAATGPALALAAAAVEALAALALLLEPTRLGGAMAATALWCGYGALLFARRGQTLDCGCDLAVRSRKVGTFAVLRPVVLAALALAVATLPVPFAWTLDSPFAALALLALWFAAAELGVLPLHSPFRMRSH